MQNFYQTQRSYTNLETKERFNMWRNENTHENILVSKSGERFNGPVYIAAFTATYIKLNTKKVVYINNGEFYHLKEGEKAISKRFFIEPRFRKI